MTQPFLPGLKRFAPVALKRVDIFEFVRALEAKGWAHYDSGNTTDGNYEAFKVDQHKRPCCSWDELKAYLLVTFGNEGRVAFGITRPEFAPEQQSYTVLLARPKLLKVINKIRKEPACP